MSAIKNISLFVPHIFSNFDKEYVADVFATFGDVSHVDFVAKQDRDGKDYNAAYIHFKRWYDLPASRKFHSDLLSDYGKLVPVKVYHDGPWYWIVLPNTAKKHVSGERKPRIDLGEAKAISINTPEKVAKAPVCPGAPKKATYAAVVSDSVVTNLADSFHAEAFDVDAAEEEAQMDEIEKEIEAEDSNLVSIDYRYVKAIEEENMWLNTEVGQLRQALINLDKMYQAEVAKVRAFTTIDV